MGKLKKDAHTYGSAFAVCTELDDIIVKECELWDAKFKAVEDTLTGALARIKELEDKWDSKSVAKRKPVQKKAESASKE